MITYQQASNEGVLDQILVLQAKNLYSNLTDEDKRSEGFVTVSHDFDLLKAMNEVTPHTIALLEDKVIGYALSMHPQFAASINILKPMFRQIEAILGNTTNFIVMGQICVAEPYRGKGVFRGLYQHMKFFLGNSFDHIITEVDVRNTRSMNAHIAVGFTELCRYEAADKTWSLIQLKL